MPKFLSLRAPSLRWLALATSVGAAIAACGGGGYGGVLPSAPGDSRGHTVTLLVSDQAGAEHLDAQFSDPWDLSSGGGSALWLTVHGAARSTLYNAGDLSLPALVVAAPAQSGESARPTGVAFNPGNGFEVTTEGRTGVARFIVASEGGTLSGWAPSLGLARAVVAFDGTSAGAVYTGLAMTAQGVDSVLLATDFHNGVVDSFAADFTSRQAEGRFVDPALPAGYAPFGIAAQGDVVYIAYAKPDASAKLPQAGAGLGLVDVFDDSGRLLRRLVPPGGALNAPWSMAVAPAGFGAFGGALLVANVGDGTITAFDATSGQALGTLTRPDGAVLAIDGLHGIAFGDGALGQPTHSLFFTAGPQGGRHGVFGRIDPQ
jgi:uncharacterized protein (TIGR03118 family)